MEKERKIVIDDIVNVVSEWSKQHKNNVSFIGGFMAFKGKDSDVVDDRLIAFGDKDSLQIHLKELKEQLQKEKGFVNW